MKEGSGTRGIACNFRLGVVQEGTGGMDASGWGVGKRCEFYSQILELVKDPSIPELTLDEARVYIDGLRERGVVIGGFFPPDVVVAARSLKLTRRLFHTEQSSICSGQGLWLNKGVTLLKGDFVGFYVGWVYSESKLAGVWDTEYLDNTYSLGLRGVTGIGAESEMPRVHARDDSFSRQDMIFTLGYANEWIWDVQGGNGKGNVLRFGNTGMVFAQRSVRCSRVRVEVTVGFGKEGVLFGGWAKYVILLAERLLGMVRLVWMQVQVELGEETKGIIASQLSKLELELKAVTFRSLPDTRRSRDLVAVLIAGVELQEADEGWGSVGYDEGMSFGDNLRRFVIHPEVRKRCTFRLADNPGKADSRGDVSMSVWDRVLLKERVLMQRTSARRVYYNKEGMERVDGQWTWCVPIPLRRDTAYHGEEVVKGVGKGENVRYRESAADSVGGESVLEANEELCGEELIEEVRSQPGVSSETGGNVRGLGWNGDTLGVSVGESGLKLAEEEDQSVFGDEPMVRYRERVNAIGSREVVEGDSQGSCGRISMGGNDAANSHPVGSRWIFDNEECEVTREISTGVVEVMFRDSRREIVTGPLLLPDADDFAGWPSKQSVVVPAVMQKELSVEGESRCGYTEELEKMGLSKGVRELLREVGMRLQAVADRRVRVATWNASGLVKMSKVRYMIALMDMANIDVLCIQDTRVEPGQWKDDIERELKKLMGVGGSVFIATVASRSSGSRGPNVGGQIILKNPRIRSSCRFYADASALGLVCWLDIQLGTHDMRIVSVYVPPAKGEKVEGMYQEKVGAEVVDRERPDMEYRGALADRVRQYIQQVDRWEGCIDYILGTAQEKIEQHMRVPGGVVMCVGDFNATAMIGEKRSVNGDIQEWAELVGLQHSMRVRNLTCPHTFYVGSEGVSAIDHVLYSSNTGVEPVAHWVLNDSLWLSLSNHCPLVVDFQMPGLCDAYVSRRGRRIVSVRERLDICRLQGHGDEEVLPRDVGDYQNYINNRLRSTELRGERDSQLELVMRVTKAALRSVRRRRRKTDWWSPLVIALTANLIAIQEMERYALGRGRPKWNGDREWTVGVQRIVQNWRRQVQKVREFNGKGVCHDLLRVSGKGPEAWVRVVDQPISERLRCLGDEIRRVRVLLRQQERVEVRQMRQDMVVRRFDARSKGKHLKELRDMMGGKSSFSMEYVVDSGLYVVNEKQVHSIVSDHFNQWFRRKERDWGFLSVDCDYMRLWEDEDYFMRCHEESNIPRNLLNVIWSAMRSKVEVSEAQHEFEQNLMQAPTLAEFEQALAMTSRHSASGPSGVTYNAIAGWPHWVLQKVHLLMVENWNDKRVPRCWKWRWLVPIPKTQDNVTLGDLRPLMLTDAVRKVWVSVLVHKIQSHLEKQGLLSMAQHGTLANRGTEGALVQFRNILEEARESCTNVFLSSWDVVKAFDRLQKNVQIMSWVRVGIPIEIAKYLVQMDDDGITMIRTPYAEQVWEREGVSGFSTSGERKKAEAFMPKAGTGQGNIDSPLVWTAFMDILLCALATVEEDQFYIRTNNEQGEGLSIVREIAYVDDLVSLTSRVEGLQRKADVVCAFFLIFGMDSARIKFRTFQIEWGSEYTTMDDGGMPCRTDDGGKASYILVHKEGWAARKVWLQTYRTAPPFKYLGVLFDLSNQDSASFARAMSVARTGIAFVNRSLGDFELRVEALLYCVYPKLIYSAKFASWPLKRYLELDKLFSAAFRRVLGLRRGFPEELLYAPWGVRGLGISRFSDEVQMAKLAIISRGSTADPYTREATFGLVLRGLRQQNVKPMYTQAAQLGSSFLSSQPLFIRSLTEWLEEGELNLRKGGIEAVDVSHESVVEICRRRDTPLSTAELAILESYGISAIGDILMCTEYAGVGQSRRGRSRSRAIVGLQRRGMEGMIVESSLGSYELIRYVDPNFLVTWMEDGRSDTRTYDQVREDCLAMSSAPTGWLVRWIVLPQCLQFLYGRLPLRPPQVTSIVLARDQCWCSTHGRFPFDEGWVWEILGFSGELICVRVWRVDGGVMCRQLRQGGSVRLISPSHGAATSVWVHHSELLCGGGWTLPGQMYRVMLGPDINGHGILRAVTAIFTQPPAIFFKSEMEIAMLSTIHQYAESFQGGDIYTDGSVIQESNPVVNALIPSPAINRMIGKCPVVAGALISRPAAPAAHGIDVAIRMEDGQVAGCKTSYDIEMVALTLACFVRDQLKQEVSPTYSIWSDCKSAVFKASQVDLHRVRKFGHKEHGLLLRRMFYSRHRDTSMLQHVRGHPERRLEKGKGWQELAGSEAGIFLADKIANAKMSEDERYLWENDGSIRTPMVTTSVAEVLRLFGMIDFWSVVGKDGIPILDSPITCVQMKWFERYLMRRDRNRTDKIWSSYVVTGPAAAFQDEKLYYKRAKVTKTVFNWYIRSEHVSRSQSSTQGGGSTEMDQVEEQGEGGDAVGQVCLLCGMDIRDDTEKHLYVYCTHVEISGLRLLAESRIQEMVDSAPEGVVREVLRAVQCLMLQDEHRHRVWKGMLSSMQGKQLSDVAESFGKIEGQLASVMLKSVKECFGICGSTLLEIRRKGWALGGSVRVRVRASVRDSSVNKRRQRHEVTSIATTLGILTPAAAVLWELERRKARKIRAKVHRDRTRGLPKVFVGEKLGGQVSKREVRISQGDPRVAAKKGRSGVRKEDVGTRLWDVH